MPTPVRRQRKRPNVVVFFTDQQRFDTVGLNGNPLNLTPNFDRLARQNVHVRHAFSPAPVCGPCRACLQTGTYYTRNGVFKNGPALPPHEELPNLGSTFSAAGYHTGYIGKWHLSTTHGELGPVRPEDRGGYQEWLGAQALEHTSDAYQTRLWDTDSKPVDLPGYRVDALTDASIRFIDRHKDDEKPFFLFVSYLEPHHQNHVDDYPPPMGYRDRYETAWVPPDLAALPAYGFDGNDPNRRQIGGTAMRHLGGYYGMVKRLDEAYGRLHDTLYSLGLDRDTIVLFTSDHGCHFKTRNWEYKRSAHESSIRVPMSLTGPGFEGGGDLPQLVSLVDLPPTLLEACGIDVPATMQGRSLMPLIRREGQDWPDDVFVQVCDAEFGRAVRTGRWKYVVGAVDNDQARQNAGVADAYRETELYDLQHDPYELYNLIESRAHGPVRARMRQRLLGRMKQTGEAQPTIVEVEVKGSGGQLKVETHEVEQ